MFVNGCIFQGAFCYIFPWNSGALKKWKKRGKIADDRTDVFVLYYSCKGKQMFIVKNQRKGEDCVLDADKQKEVLRQMLDTGFGGGEGTGEATPDVFTDVEESAEFIARTGVDALAIAIGNLHGRYVATPKLNIGRLKEIAARNNLPLVLHGGSGTSEEDFKACVHNGISKINVATALQMAVTEDVRKYVEDPMANYIDMKGVITEATKRSVMQHIMLFESNGKA